MQNFEKKIVVITGGASGMGRSLAIKFALEGATVLISDINEAGLAETKAAIDALKGVCKTYKVDVGNKNEVYSFAGAVIGEFKYIDVLINNAGIAIGEATLDEVKDEDFERLININMWGVIHHTQAFLEVLKSRPEAAIANTSSVFGLMGIPGQIPYCTSKFAVRGFTDSLRLELRHTTVSVTCIHPGGIDTNIVRNGIHYRDKEATVAQFEKLVMTSADKAAGIIISAIKRKAKRVMVGPDAKLIRLMTQLSPTLVDMAIIQRKESFDKVVKTK